MPVEAMVGKMQGLKKEGARFYVGYQRSYSVKNMFQARMRVRTSAVSSSELAARQKFTVANASMRTEMQDPAHALVFVRKFRAQTKYSTLNGFAMSEAYKYYDDSTHTVVWPANYWS